MFGNEKLLPKELQDFYVRLITNDQTKRRTRTMHQWRIFTMLYEERLSHKEICKRLEITESTLKNHVKAIEKKFGMDFKALCRWVHNLERGFSISQTMKLAKLAKAGYKISSV